MFCCVCFCVHAVRRDVELFHEVYYLLILPFVFIVMMKDLVVREMFIFSCVGFKLTL